MVPTVIIAGIVCVVVFIFGMLMMLARFFRKVEQGQALVRNGVGGTNVSFSGMMIIPILHRSELIDISVKRIMIDRSGSEGLICMDNMRADIKVAFFIRVNKTKDDVLKVAQSIGCERASNRQALQDRFEAKFSEALKTVGKQFNFIDLYNSRDDFKDEILKIIGTDLNGFIMDDAAIDFLEQTDVQSLNPDNILDSEGIKKITDLTSKQKILANQIDREKEKIITKQNVEAREAVLELNRQQAEAENRQKREVETVKAREEAETMKVQQEERLRAERAKIATDEELHVAEENKERQITVARKNKERTEAVETERVEKDRMIEATERERIVSLAQIEKEKAIEVEKKNISNVIRERVMVDKTVVEEKERIKDTEAFAGAEREKKVAVTLAVKTAEESLVIDVKAAEAGKKVAELEADQAKNKVIKAAEAARQSAELNAEKVVIEAEARQSAADKDSTAKKALAAADIEEKAAPGLAQVKVSDAQATVIERRGTAEAKVLELKAQAEAKGTEMNGTAQARVETMKYQAEAKGIENKANAMKLFDGIGREHEEFKLRLNKDKEIELAGITVRKDIAAHQSEILAQALKSAKIDIVGGEATFFDRVVNAVSGGKAIDHLVSNSETLTDVRKTFFNDDPEFFKSQLARFFRQFGMTPEDLKNVSISAALTRLVSLTDDESARSDLYGLIAMAERAGLSNKPASTIPFESGSTA